MRGSPGMNLTRDTVLLAISKTSCNFEAARYLDISYATWKKYAKMYTDDEGVSLLEVHKRINVLEKKKKRIAMSDTIFYDAIKGNVNGRYFKSNEIKKKIIQGNYIEEKCSCCGFDERRATDLQIPLLLTFKDGVKTNWDLENLYLLCYNCYYLNIGGVYTRKQIEYIEGRRTVDPEKMNKQISNLNETHLKKLEDILNNKVEEPYKQSDLDPDDLADTY